MPTSDSPGPVEEPSDTPRHACDPVCHVPRGTKRSRLTGWSPLSVDIRAKLVQLDRDARPGGGGGGRGGGGDSSKEKECDYAHLHSATSMISSKEIFEQCCRKYTSDERDYRQSTIASAPKENPLEGKPTHMPRRLRHDRKSVAVATVASGLYPSLFTGAPP